MSSKVLLWNLWDSGVANCNSVLRYTGDDYSAASDFYIVSYRNISDNTYIAAHINMVTYDRRSAETVII